MTPLANTTISANPAAVRMVHSRFEKLTILVSLLLFLLLVFTTATVWVRQAWALQIFQIGIFTLVAVRLVAGFFSKRREIAPGIIPLFVYLIPIWGVIQIIFHTTTSSFDTREAVLRWGSLAGVFYLTQTVTYSRASRQRFLAAMLGFAIVMAVIFLVQFNTSDGRILWVFPSGFSTIFATFQNKNNYVQFVEISLPIALWGAVCAGWRSWWYAIAAGVLYASAIGAASRAGFVLCTAELLMVAILGVVRLRQNRINLTFRAAVLTLVLVPVVAGSFTFAVGWDKILARLKQEDPFFIRREYFLGAVEMARHRPLTGYGLDTFEQVYQRFAIRDYGLYANHAHNDWAEFAADGGIPFLLLVAIPFFAAVPAAFRNPWGLGLVATMLNAGVDFPFPRPAVSSWMFAMLAVLYMTREPRKALVRPLKAKT